MKKKITPKEMATLSFHDDWKTSDSHVVYLTTTTRFKVDVENNKDKDYLKHISLEEESNSLQDMQEQSNEFAINFLNTVGEQLSVRQMTSMITTFSNQIAQRNDGKERIGKIIAKLNEQIND